MKEEDQNDRWLRDERRWRKPFKEMTELEEAKEKELMERERRLHRRIKRELNIESLC